MEQSENEQINSGIPNREISVVVAQVSPKKGDYHTNVRRVGEMLTQINNDHLDCDILVLPETYVTGYFLEGGVFELAVTSEKLKNDLYKVYKESNFGKPIHIVIGFYEEHDGSYYNSAMYACFSPEADKAKIAAVHRKFFLPTYGVFDEERFVSKGHKTTVFDTDLGRFGMLICEDVWHSITGTLTALKGANLLFVLTASPGRGFTGEIPSNAERYRRMLVSIAEEHGMAVVNSSLTGFEGGKGFVGCSMAVDPFGKILLEGPLAEEALLTVKIHPDDTRIARANLPLLADLRSNIASLSEELEEVAEDMINE